VLSDVTTYLPPTSRKNNSILIGRLGDLRRPTLHGRLIDPCLLMIVISKRDRCETASDSSTCGLYTLKVKMLRSKEMVIPAIRTCAEYLVPPAVGSSCCREASRLHASKASSSHSMSTQFSSRYKSVIDRFGSSPSRQLPTSIPIASYLPGCTTAYSASPPDYSPPRPPSSPD
jgi:hypothetical protein